MCRASICYCSHAFTEEDVVRLTHAYTCHRSLQPSLVVTVGITITASATNQSRTHMATGEPPVLCGDTSKRASQYSNWTNITWIHIPKAGRLSRESKRSPHDHLYSLTHSPTGTSWYNTFFHYACPRADRRLELQPHMFWLNNWEQVSMEPS